MKKLIILLILIPSFMFGKVDENKYKQLYTEYKRLTEKYTKLLKEHEKTTKEYKTLLEKIKKITLEHNNTLDKLKSSNDNSIKLISEIEILRKLIKTYQDTKEQEKPRFNIIYYLGYNNQFQTGIDLNFRLFSVWKLDFNLKIGGYYLGDAKTFNFNGYFQINLGL